MFDDSQVTLASKETAFPVCTRGRHGILGLVLWSLEPFRVSGAVDLGYARFVSFVKRCLPSGESRQGSFHLGATWEQGCNLASAQVSPEPG